MTLSINVNHCMHMYVQVGYCVIPEESSYSHHDVQTAKGNPVPISSPVVSGCFTYEHVYITALMS